MMPTPGTKPHAYLEENVAALDVTLSPQELRRIDQIVLAAVGARYPEEVMKAVGR